MQLNSTKPFAGLFATLTLMYLIYLLLAGTPLDRIDRTCAPFFIWPGKAVTSAVGLFAPDAVAPVSAKFQSGFGMCRKWVWLTFYQAEYDRMRRQSGAVKAGGAS